jgi:hypothetical protein
MNRAWAILILAGMILAGAGCKGFDDSQEQTEYERLRTSPRSPQPDRVLPSFEGPSTTEDASPFAALGFRHG